MRYLALAASAVLSLCASGAFAGDDAWKIDPVHSSANFSIRHMMVSNVKGGFEKVGGTVVYDGKNLKNAKVDATIEVASIDTREAKRDEHLRTPEFFDVAKYPTITFKSKRVQQVKSGKFQLVGDLTMHGVTKQVSLDVDGPTPAIKDPMGKQRMGASATARLNRKDFGISYNKLLDTGGAMLGDDVKVEIELELIKEAPRQAEGAPGKAG